MSAFALAVAVVAGVGALVRAIQTGELEFRLLFPVMVVLAISQALVFRSSRPDSSDGNGTST
jgi:hypothetical protein